MGLLQTIGAQDASYLPYLNTGTPYDLITGAFVPGLDNHFILNGGLAATNGVMGRPQQFKSTFSNGLLVNALARYPGSVFYLNDTEFALGNKRRILEMVNLHTDDPEAREKLLTELMSEDRFVITNPTEHDLESFVEKIKQIDAYKTKHKDDFTIEIPLLDHRTGKPRRMMIPTLVSVDSLTMAPVRSALEDLENNDASSSKNNTVFMKDGNAKTKITRILSLLSGRSGIYIMCTAHVGNKIDMTGGFAPPTKDMQYMKQGDKVKGVGSDFIALMSNLVEIRSASVLLDGDKECEYPLASGITDPNEMSTINTILTRCKNNNGGAQFTPVVSQSQGLQSALTNYHYLRKHEYFGFAGNNRSHQPVLLPDVTLQRTQATKKLTDYKTSRAVEILAQLCYVQNSWTVRDDIKQYQMTPEQLTDGLVKRSGYAMDDILNSRGWWTYANHPRSYLSLFDILDIASGNYKPKLHAVIVPETKKK